MGVFKFTEILGIFNQDIKDTGLFKCGRLHYSIGKIHRIHPLKATIL